MLLVLPKFYDLHAHLRDGDLLKVIVPHHTASSAYVLVMPTSSPNSATNIETT
jgi:dihydroorotase